MLKISLFLIFHGHDGPICVKVESFLRVIV